MQNIQRFSFLLMFIFVLVSCQKEYSIETGGNPPPGSTTNCKINEFIETDAQTGVAEVGYISSYDVAQKVSKVEIWDSLSDVLVVSYPLSYPTNKVQVDADQYFITGPDGKITEFHGFEDPADTTSAIIIARYTYNSSGQLIKRTTEDVSLPGIVLVQTDYTYTGGNLTKAEARFNTGTTMQLFGVVNYEYDLSKKVKNFLYLHALAGEIFYFQTAIDAGSNSSSPVSKTTLSLTDPITGIVSNYESNFVNYSIDTDQYVKSFEITGYDFAIGGLFSGKKYNIKYSCL